ncbi:response regulator transcription factor [Companilactobacillus jidongensis]|uniref:response regulator transcription factor n=1 Tax=Companilactobacillus jidongensis TaxID=2486006 RepID=UPI000F7BA29D|nr:response regulator transcription factor [Companilactobacillus jidongensis]
MYSVLLVDDEYMILKGLERIIDWSEFGFKISNTCKSTVQALDYLENSQVDLVIADVNMPTMTGLEMIEAAQHKGISFEFVILSGYQDFEYVQHGLQMGAVDYLLKPIDANKLKDVLVKIKTKLDADNLFKEQLSKITNITMQQLLLNELNDDEKKDFLSNYNLSNEVINAGITVIACNRLQSFSKILDFCHGKNQPLLYSDDDTLFIAFIGNNGSLIKFMRNLENLQYITGESYMTVGSRVSDWASLTESFEQSKKLGSLYKFYTRKDNFLSNQTRMDWLNQATVPKFTLTEIRTAINNNDYETSISILKQIFSEFSKNAINPSYARQMAFLIFLEIHKKMDLSDKEYQDIVVRINKSSSWQKLEDLLTSMIDMLLDQQNQNDFMSLNVQKTIEIVNREYQDDINLSLISERLQLNTNYLGQLFKKEIGESFASYLNHYRIRKAKELLSDSQRSVADIALDVGYVNTGYFFKNFRKISGLSPKEFRQQSHEMSN